MKKLSLLLIVVCTALTMQMRASQAQPRYPGAGGSPEVSRTTLPSDDRYGMQALKTRSIGAKSTSFANHPLNPSGISMVAPKRGMARTTLVSPTLNVFGTVIFSDDWTESNAPYGVYRLPVTDGKVTDLMFRCNSPLYSFFDGDHTVYSMYELAYGTWVMGYDLYKYDTETNLQSGII